MREETEEVEGESGGVRVFLSENGVEVLRKNIAKKGCMEEKVFKELLPPFKEEIERKC